MFYSTMFAFLVRISVVALLSIGSAHGVLIDSNDATIGAGTSADGNNITSDTSTFLDWLDLDLSSGMTFAQVTAEFGAGGLFDGFRHATLLELSGHAPGVGGQVDSLYMSAGLGTFVFSQTSGTAYADVRALLGHIGCYGPACANYGYVTGILVDGDGNIRNTYLEAFTSSTNWGRSGEWLTQYNLLAPNGCGIPFDCVVTGHWLVRATPQATVPEPGTLGLLGAGLLGLAFARRKKAA